MHPSNESDLPYLDYEFIWPEVSAGRFEFVRKDLLDPEERKERDARYAQCIDLRKARELYAQVEFGNVYHVVDIVSANMERGNL